MLFWITLILILLGLFLVFRKKSPKVFLKGEKTWQKVTLIDVKQISHDTKIFTFGFEDILLGLPLGSHLLFQALIPTVKNPSGEVVVRKYTPTSPYDVKGKIEFPIKIYYKNTHPAFPEGGLMTQYLDSLKIGDQIEVSGPKGNLRYLNKGTFKIGTEPSLRVNALGLIAGGTGITPCFQLIQYIIENETNPITLHLIYANKTETDILLREKLEFFANSGKLKLFYTLDNPPTDWNYGTGFITEEVLRKNLPLTDAFICYCGPPPMTNMLAKQLKSLGYSNTFKF